MTKPYFSIAIPAYGYNGKGVEFLEHNFNILKSQTFTDFEIVLSDHSTDNTIKKVYDVWKDFLNIKYLPYDKGRGFISPNLNNSIKNCNGEWIKILFQDDFLFDENSLYLQKEFLEQNKDTKWLITTFYHSNDGINFYNLYHPKLSNNIWAGNNTLGNPSNLTIINDDLIFFDENLNWLVDCEYYHRLFLKHGNPKILKEITVVNRTHGDGLTDKTPQIVKNNELNILMSKYDYT